MKLFTTIGTGVAVFALASTALAQEVNAQASTTGVALPGTQRPVTDSDHSQMVGRLAVGYMGRQTIQAGSGLLGALAPQDSTLTLNAPVIGMRYWLDNMIGIDAGVGFNFSTGSLNAGGSSVDKAGVAVVMLHGGLPLNLADAGHFSFQVVPEATLGFASVGDVVGGADELTRNGFLLSLGARAGAEIHFGFMGIPQLSLQGSVGLYLRHQSRGSSHSSGGVNTDSSDNSLTIGTTLGNNPWDIFASNISALYYF